MHPSHNTFGRQSAMAHLVFASIVALLALAFFCIVGYQVLSAEGAAGEAASTLSGTIGQEEALQNANTLAEQTRSQRQTLATLPIPSGQGAAFIAEVEHLGVLSGTQSEITAVSATPSKSATPGSLSLTIAFSGSYTQIMRFIGLLETQPVSSSISALSLQYDPTAKTWNGTLSFSVLSFDTP
ncbi:MAG: hypothetical protein KGJ34_01330 [Patescibacteria group bacterium]|nr:hypothetical protein [Patescibacteria group bacterium]